jgi:hypothetical protein
MIAQEIPMAPAFKERAYGHPEIWECTLDEMINKCSPVLQAQWNKHKLKKEVVKLAASFLRIKFERKQLKGEIGYEVCQAIDESLIYHVNCLGVEVQNK